MSQVKSLPLFQVNYIVTKKFRGEWLTEEWCYNVEARDSEAAKVLFAEDTYVAHMLDLHKPNHFVNVVGVKEVV